MTALAVFLPGWLPAHDCTDVPINIGVQFDKPKGETIAYNGRLFSICEPTPYGVDLAVGQSAPLLKGAPYRVVYAHDLQEKTHR